VGIGGGILRLEDNDDVVDVRLGDIIVNKPSGIYGGVI
jgi:hypothetical protein